MRELGKDGILREVKVISVEPHAVRKLKMNIKALEEMAEINNISLLKMGRMSRTLAWYRDASDLDMANDGGLRARILLKDITG